VAARYMFYIPGRNVDRAHGPREAPPNDRRGNRRLFMPPHGIYRGTTVPEISQFQPPALSPLFPEIIGPSRPSARLELEICIGDWKHR